MVKKILMLLGTMFLMACPPPETNSVIINNNATPGQVRELGQAMASALSCSPSGLTWSIREAANPGFVSPRDGAITQTGTFTSPQCGSIYVGTIMHVVATCSANGLTGTVNMAIAEEQIQTLNVALGILNPGTPQACVASPIPQGASCLGSPTPCDNPDGCYCLTFGQQIQFYAQLQFTCTTVWSPDLPATMPPNCP